MTDLELLREYAEERSERAFTELVYRHMDLVFSTALRLVQTSQLAEDVTQIVFIRLARKAGDLRRGTLIAGWLYRTTQFVAQVALRSEWRRRKRESSAMQHLELNRDSESIWKDVAPLLEKAMSQLRQPDQDAVLLRFFAGKSLREVGEALGVNDDTAQKRVNRAVDRMRSYFARHGVEVPATLLSATLAAHSIQAAPIQLASSLAATLTSSAAKGLSVGTSLKLWQAMLMAKLKTYSVAVAITAVVIVNTAVVLLQPSAAPVSPTNDLANAAVVLRGQVQTPDGRPLAGALVRAATPQATVRLYVMTNSVPRTNITSVLTNQSVRATPPAPSAVTGTDGRFAIGLSEMPRDGLSAVVATSDAGYGLVTGDELSANPVVVVQPWARIEGVLRVGKAPASNETVNIGIWGATELYDWNLVQHGASTKTDANGRFVFTRVAPVDVWLTHTVMVRTNDGRQNGHQFVKVRPGDQIKVQLGGTGRTVIGRVIWNSTEKLVFYGSMWAQEVQGIRHPRNWKKMTREAQRQYERAWRESPEGELFKDSVRNYEFPVKADGTFRIDDVREGRYRMQVRADEPVPGGRGQRHAAVAEVFVDVTGLFPGERDEPIDVGELLPTRPNR